MPTPTPELHTRFVVARAGETVGSVMRKLPDDREERAFTYIVLPVAGGSYIIVRWLEIERIAAAAGRDISFRRLEDLPGLPEPIAAVALDGTRLVVLAGGTVAGVLAADDATEPLGADPFAKTASGLSFGLDEPELTQPTVRPESFEIPSERAATGEDPPPTQEERVINAWVTDMAGNQPLQLGATYDLNFNVGAPRADAVAMAFDNEKVFGGLPPEQQQVEVLVMIETDDFTIAGDDQQSLIVPRVGKSANVVTFKIEPKRDGPGVVKAFFYANNRVFQKMTITLQVGAVVPNTSAWKSELSGITMSSAMAQPARRQEQIVNLMIVKKEASYQFILQSGGVTRALLNLSETQIAELIANARDALKGIVYTLVNNEYVYQLENTAIPADIHTASLKVLARLGVTLYRKLFYGAGSGADARAMGDLLRKISQQKKLHIEIIAERFIFPWSLLYDRDDLLPDLSNVDPNGFWGFKHIIEYTPEFSSATPVNFIPQISVSDKLGLGFVYNTTIDTQMGRPIIQGQRDFLKTLDGLRLTEYASTQELCTLLNDPETPAQVLYFYCHAVSNIPGDKGGVAGSKVVLSDGAISLDDLNFQAPTDRAQLKQAPLVFMNCCQSAELSPYLYDGLVPYLIGKGARGVIGTEVDTPALFAAEFAKEFLKRFIAGGQTLGELLLDMRREYLIQKSNVMGLVYALYSSGEVIVQRS